MLYHISCSDHFYNTLMLLLHHFWSLKASVPIHCNSIGKNTKHTVHNFPFCIPETENQSYESLFLVNYYFKHLSKNIINSSKKETKTPRETQNRIDKK